MRVTTVTGLVKVIKQIQVQKDTDSRGQRMIRSNNEQTRNEQKVEGQSKVEGYDDRMRLHTQMSGLGEDTCHGNLNNSSMTRPTHACLTKLF